MKTNFDESIKNVVKKFKLTKNIFKKNILSEFFEC